MAHLSPDELAALVAEPSPPPAAQTRAHLEGCDSCRQERDELARVLADVRSAGGVGVDAPGPEVWARVQRALDAEPEAAGAAPSSVRSAPSAATHARTHAPTGSRRPAPVAAPSRRPGPRRSPALLAAAVGLVVGVGGTLGVLQLRQEAAPSVVARADLAPLPGETGEGTAELVRSHDALQLRVHTVLGSSPTADYREVWLLNGDGQRMYALGVLPSTGDGSYWLPPPLSAQLDGYATVDISLEPDDGNAAHSGHSLVRGELPRLRRTVTRGYRPSMIVVTGATGNVGRCVVEQLVAAGEDVRALSRRPERADWPGAVESVQGDLTAELPPGLFAGARAAYLFPEPARATEVVRAAEAAGVQHVVVLSSLAAGFAGRGLDALQRRHLDVEEAVEASGMSWTHLRPGMFMTNTLGWAEAVRTDGVVREPYPHSTAAPVHEADIAAVGVAALLDPQRHAGRAYPMSGPEALSQLDRVRILGEVLGRPVRFEEQSREEARAQMLASPWMNEHLADTLLDMLAGASRPPGPGRAGEVDADETDLVLPTVQEVLGRPPRTFASWVGEHRDAFTAGT